METIKIDIINPKAKKLLKDLADLKLISIRKSNKNNFSVVLEKLRSQSDTSPSLDEITREVEAVRSERHRR
jgi:hypothetical protein